jgi:hypothetical protein
MKDEKEKPNMEPRIDAAAREPEHDRDQRVPWGVLPYGTFVWGGAALAEDDK